MDDPKTPDTAPPARRMTPSAIVRYLDQYVIGQDDAKRTVAVAVYAHYRKLGRARDPGGLDAAKANILIIGPTGSGKTLLCETLARGLGVPFVTADATSLAQSKYVNEEIEAILLRLLDRAGGHLARAQHGIVFIDEVDKLKAAGDQGESHAGARVQHALLKIMEGSRVRLGNDRDIDTADILFICGGAFVGLESIAARTRTYGFIATSDDDNQKILDRLNARTKPTDLFQFGLIPEFTGRLPVIARFETLSRDALVRIMTEPRNALYHQYRELFRAEGVELRIDARVFEQIADLAAEYQVGARSLRGIFEEMIAPVLYVTPDRPDIRRVIIRSLFEEARFETA